MTVHPVRDAYQPTVGVMAEYREGAVALGDPAKGAQAILKIASVPEPPLRLLLGSDAFKVARAADEANIANDEAWKELTLSPIETPNNRTGGASRDYGGRHPEGVWGTVTPGPLICRILAAGTPLPPQGVPLTARPSGRLRPLVARVRARGAHVWRSAPPPPTPSSRTRTSRPATGRGRTSPTTARSRSTGASTRSAPRSSPRCAANRAYFNAGVVGPDGFPDLTYGQSVIHPGADRQVAQARAHEGVGGAERPAPTARPRSSQILAFAYGYLTHAAGDMWAHTLVNDVAGGVFPSVGEILTDVDDAEIAIRHIIVEGYVGDATPGYDGNDGRAVRSPARSTRTATPRSPTTPRRTSRSRRRSASSTRRSSTRPTRCPVGTSRGPLIDFFLDMQAELQVSEARYACDSEFEDCLHPRPGLLRAHQDADRPDRARPAGHAHPIQQLRGRLLLRGRPGRPRRRPHDRQPGRDLPRALDR